VGDLLRAVGGRNIAEDATSPFPSYSLERLLERAPAVLIIGSHATGAPPLTPITRLTNLPAVRDKRVHAVDGDLLFRPGPRVLEGIEALEPLLHPGADGGAR
jgi:iron complex transport system substrate-binding protein